jgi:phosphatidylglycerol:prolipoprotein diacylglycerol transferase
VPDVIKFDFDPTASPFGLSIRLETLALCGVIFMVLVLIALRAGRAPVPDVASAADSHAALDAAVDSRGSRASGGRLRRDDLILIAFGVVPGAVVGGRLSYILIHLDYYNANPGALADPSRGGLGLTLAVILGIVSGLAVARLLAAPIERWLHVAGVPVLLGLGFGKLAMLYGGTGQGSYSDSSFATSYVGSGPWGSLNPDFPALPSQAIEGVLVLAAAAIVMLVPLLLRLRLRRWRSVVRPGWSPRREWSWLNGGTGFATVISLWIIARFVAAFTWRDARVAGPFNAEQIVLLVVLALVLASPSVPSDVRRVRRSWSAWRAARTAAAKARHAAEVQAQADARSAGEPGNPPAR